jgi:5-methylcytosine-specific restriction protein A
MPTAPLHYCSASARCPNKTTGGPCPEHQHARRQAWATERGTTQRLRGRGLQQKRAALFAREPNCRECRKHGRFTKAVIRDHVIPLAEGGTDDDTNTQPLCQDCSDVKTRAESARGVRKSWERKARKPAWKGTSGEHDSKNPRQLVDL